MTLIDDIEDVLNGEKKPRCILVSMSQDIHLAFESGYTRIQIHRALSERHGYKGSYQSFCRWFANSRTNQVQPKKRRNTSLRDSSMPQLDTGKSDNLI